MSADGLPPQRLVLLSGGSRGLGAALAAGWRGEGWRVLTLSRTEPPDTPPGDWIRADLADPVAAAAALSAALAGIDPTGMEALIVLHNAATLEPLGPVEQAAPEALAAGLQVGLIAGVTLLAAAMAHFRASPGRKIVAQVSSGAALRSHAGLTVYGAAKAGVISLMKSIATEYGGRGIRANTIAPGPMDTPPVRAWLGTFEDGLARFARQVPSGRLGTGEDIARAAVFLASDAAEFINGAVVPVDGAVHARLSSPQID